METNEQRDPVDIADLTARLDGDDTLILTVLNVFNKSCSLQMEMLETALASDDFRMASRTVHTIAGAAGNASVQEMKALALRLEEALARGDRKAVGTLSESLNGEYARFKTWLSSEPSLTRQDE